MVEVFEKLPGALIGAALIGAIIGVGHILRCSYSWPSLHSEIISQTQAFKFSSKVAARFLVRGLGEDNVRAFLGMQVLQVQPTSNSTGFLAKLKAKLMPLLPAVVFICRFMQAVISVHDDATRNQRVQPE